MEEQDKYLDNHFIHRSNWLRAAFLGGGILHLLGVLFLPVPNLVYYLYGLSILLLSILGAIAEKTGGSSITKAVIRVTFWGTVAMVLTAIVGYLFNVNL
jgi:VIT1/CCC1 family predicted Fe2+/Mn2+ transporter